MGKANWTIYKNTDLKREAKKRKESAEREPKEDG